VSSAPFKMRNVISHPNPEIGGTRVSFELAPEGEKSIELRAHLMRGDDVLSEVWMNRWTP
jgi:periplasmic glucans biosynthesis protein